MTEPQEILIEKKKKKLDENKTKTNLWDVSVKQIYWPLMGRFLDSYPSYPNSCLSQSNLQINKHKHFKRIRG